MRIAVVGCGAVGSFYGAKLARDGHDVSFLLRSDFEAVRRNGILIRSPQGDFQVQPRCARAPEEIGPSSLVLIGLKTTANAQFASLLPPLVGPVTAILTLQNGLGNEQELARLFPMKQIMGGLCFVCLNRSQPGVIQHLDYGQIVLGEFQRLPEPRTHAIASMFCHAGMPCTVTANLTQTHWEKLTWNIPFNGLGVAGVAGFDAVCQGRTVSGGTSRKHFGLGGTPRTTQIATTLTTDKLLADPRWEKLVRELILEVVATARALGLSLDPGLADQQILRTRTMGAYKASTLIDFERGLPLELQSLFLEPLRQAREAGVNTPRLAALCEVLKSLDAGRNN